MNEAWNAGTGVTRRTALGGAFAAGVCLGTEGLFAAPAAGEAQMPGRPWAKDPRYRLPLLAFGCADRFPQKRGHGKNSVDYEFAAELVDYAMKHGVNWFDTGYVYHAGESEKFLGKTLVKYPRESYILSDKMPAWKCDRKEDIARIFEEQLARCHTEYFDFYLLHSIGSKPVYEKVYKQWGGLAYLREQKAKGRIRHLGLSFHGKSDFLEEVLTENPDLEVCMVMQNAMEHTWNKDSRKFPEICVRHGVSVLVMEPLAGGRAAGLRGKSMEPLLKVHPEDTPAKWGLRYAASLPGVVCLMSGMNKLAHLQENIRTLGAAFKPLDEAEKKAYDEAIGVYMKYKSIPCTGCRYCMPCPYGLPIPEIFAWYSEWAQSGRLPADEGPNDSQDLRRRFLASYYNKFPSKTRADRCLGCKKCLVSCPQWTFRIPVEMGRIADLVARTENVYVQKGGVIR